MTELERLRAVEVAAVALLELIHKVPVIATPSITGSYQQRVAALAAVVAVKGIGATHGFCPGCSDCATTPAVALCLCGHARTYHAMWNVETGCSYVVGPGDNDFCPCTCFAHAEVP